MLTTSQNDRMATTPLLAKLSMSVTNIVDLFEAVRCSMSWQFGEESSRCLKAILLRSPTEAIVFVNDSSIAKKMSADPIVHLSGPLTASFTDGVNLLTEFVRIECVHVNYTLRDVAGLLRGPDNPPGFQHCTFFCGDKEVIVGLQSSSQAEALQQKLSAQSLPGVHSSRQVTTSDHTVVEMAWRPLLSSTSLSEVLVRLTRTGHSLLSTLQSVVCASETQPCIVGATVLAFGSSSTSSSESPPHPDLAVICATAGDAALLRARVEIPLGSAGSLFVTGAASALPCFLAPTPPLPAPQSLSSPLVSNAGAAVIDTPPGMASMASLLGNHKHRVPTVPCARTCPAAPAATAPINASPICSLPRSDVLYVLWDMQACPLFTVPGGQHEDKVSVVLSNLEGLLRVAMPSREGLVLSSSASGKVCKLVILPGESVSNRDLYSRHHSKCCSARQMSDLQALRYTIATCEEASDSAPDSLSPFGFPLLGSGLNLGLDLGTALSLSSTPSPDPPPASATSSRLLRELDGLISRHAADAVKPAVCVLTSGALFSTLCETLKRGGFTNALLVINTMERKATSPSSAINLKHMPWEAVRHLHELSDKERKVVSGFSGDYNGIERLRKCKVREGEWVQAAGGGTDDAISSVSTSSGFGGTRAAVSKPMAASAPDSSSSLPYSRSVKVSRFSMAAHVSNLIKWKEEECAAGSVPPGAQSIDEMFAICEDGVAGGRGESKEGLGRVQIEVLIDREKRRQHIEVRGDTEEGVRYKAEQVEQLLSRMNASRRVLRMHGWKSQHREALMGSIPLNLMAQKCRASVVFHSTDGYIVSEMMALSEESIDQMAGYLKNLRPVEASWTFDSRHLVPEPKIRFWNAIRNRFGVMFEKKQRKNKLEVSAWGFGELLDEAYEDVLAASQGNPVSYPTGSNSSASTAAVTFSGGGNSSRVPLLLPAPPASPAPPSSTPAPGIFSRRFVFQDPEAAAFFFSFEEMFAQFLKHTFNALVSAAAGESSKGAVDLRGRDEQTLLAAETYLASLSSQLNCYELEALPSSASEQLYGQVIDLQVRRFDFWHIS
jgi:hypothetical protein